MKKGNALLLSLWNQKSYVLQKDMKGITFDDFFIIFGNSELRIKTQDTKIFSNFGLRSNFFAN